ncbi:alpha/beta fold hydrolase [Herbiconiux sp.]|uniref:alpha/beta fold hydrolase n=1 Tax=Herbiconiux sp. TaxID=1871186 RepID=UPI0025C40FD2|nr:alpha/beta fold hydrolase [Herbiconiux sp.]
MTDSDAPIRLEVERVRFSGETTRVTRVTVDGVTSERAFVLVAGVGVAATYFEFLAPTLAQHGPVYALDLPGFAGLPRPNEQPTAEYFAGQVQAVLEHYALENPVVLGHSMGTQVVTELLVRRPDLTHAVLVSPVINEAESAPGVQGIRFAQSAVHETPHLALTALSAYILCGVVYFLTVLPHMLRYRISERIGLVQAQTLFIRGELDRTSPRRFHTRLRQRARDARSWEIEGAAHSIINAHAIGVAELIRRHLGGSLARRGRMPAEQAAVPPAQHADAELVLGAIGSRAAEWVSTLRGDDRGIARAKRAHAKILWRAFRPRR